MGEELIVLSPIKELVVRNEEKKEYHYKKTGPINLTSMAKRLNSTVRRCFKA
jgi:hypothetical protein